MKLLLTSYRLPVPKALFDLAGKQPADIKVAIIPNAGDYYAERPKSIKQQDNVEYFTELGVIKARIVDLGDYEHADELHQALQDVDVVWASGGNTFMLRQQMKRSGFDTVIRELLEEGVVYAGESAGALVAGNSLKGVEYADDPRFIEEEIWDGIGLIDKFVLPHVDSPFFSDSIDKTMAEHAGEDIIELTDQQMLIINGDQVKILTGEQA